MVPFALKNSAMKKPSTEERIIGILHEADAPNAQIPTIIRRHNSTQTTIFRWRNKYGGMGALDERRLKVLEAENAKLKKLLAEQLLAIDSLKEFSRGK